MNRSAVVVLALFAVLLSGCYHATVETGRQPSGQVVENSWAHGFVYGLVPPSTVQVAQQCPNGVAKVETQLSFLNQLASAFTFGIYTPMQISVQCAAGAVAQNALAMLDGGVTFVATKPVVGIDPVERDHHPVPMNLGEDGCRADRGHLVITAYDRVTVHLPVVEHEIRQPVAVHLDGAGTDTEAQDRTAHREKGCLQNVDPVDFRRVSPCYRPCNRPCLDQRRKFFPALGSELLGIAQVFDRPSFIENDCRRDDRPRKRTTPGLVDTRNGAARGK